MDKSLDGVLWVSGPEYDYGSDDALYYDETHRNHVVCGSFEWDGQGRAIIAVAVLGYCKVRVNELLIDGVELRGWWTDYSKAVYFERVDVTALLRLGQNVISIELGNGFYNPAPLSLFGKYNLRERLSEVGTPRVACAVVDDSGRRLAQTGEDWSWSEGPLLFNNVYLGEVRDMGPSPSSKGPVRTWRENRILHLAPAPSCKRTGRVPAVSVSDKGDYVLVDLGQVVAGFVDVMVRANDRQRVTLVYAETLRDGKPCLTTSVAGYVGVRTPRGICPGGPGAPELACQQDVMVCEEGVNHFVNEFCWHSFRYVLIYGVCPDDVISVSGVRVNTSLRQIGHVETGNEAFDALHGAALRTRLNNVHGVIEDCARERFGYGGDMIALAVANSYDFDMVGMLDKTLADFSCAQTSRGGLPETVPFMGIGSNGPAYGEGPLLWQIAYPYLAVTADRYFGRTDLLKREWKGIARFGEYLMRQDPAELATHCLGDHGSIETGEDFKNGTPDKDFVGWCAILWGVQLVRECAYRLGQEDAAYRAFASSLAEKIRALFGNSDGSFAGRSQTSYAFAAALGLGNREALTAELAHLIAEEGVFSTGIFGTSFAFDLLNGGGYDDIIERWLMRRESPSLRTMLASGNGVLVEQFDDPLASCDHAMFSSYEQWFYQGLAGIRVLPDAVGANRIRIRPYLSKETDCVRCSYEGRSGEVRVVWERLGACTRVEIAVPEGIDATIEIPRGHELVRSESWGASQVLFVREH